MRRLLTAALAVTLPLAGCGSSTDPTPPTPPATPAAGSYTLQTVDGAALPYKTATGDQLLSERLQVNADGTFGDTAQYVPAGGGSRTDTQIASWSGTGGAVRLFDGISGATIAQGSLSGAVLTLADSGVTKAYEKQ